MSPIVVMVLTTDEQKRAKDSAACPLAQRNGSALSSMTMRISMPRRLHSHAASE